MSKLILFLSMMWALSLLYGEWIAFLVPSLSTCSWPHLHCPSLPSLNGVDDRAILLTLQSYFCSALHFARRCLANLPCEKIIFCQAFYYQRQLSFQISVSKVYHLSGNYDMGYAAVNSRKPDIIKRYEKEFGGRTFKVTLGKVDFIAVDAQTLDGYPPSDLTSAAWNFIRNVFKDMDSTPRVLLTHIPLYRPDWSPCGPHRSSEIINQVPELYH